MRLLPAPLLGWRWSWWGFSLMPPAWWAPMALLGGGRRKKQALSPALLPGHATARRPCRLLGVLRRSWAMEGSGVGRILNQALLGPGWHGAQIAGCHFTQFAEISGSRWWLRLGSGGPMTVLLLVSFGFGGLAVDQCHASYGSFGLVSCWVRDRLGQCPARLDSFDLLARAHDRGGLRSERWISPMLRLYVQEGGLSLRLCMHRMAASFGAYMYRSVFLWRLDYFTWVRSRLTSDTPPPPPPPTTTSTSTSTSQQRQQQQQQQQQRGCYTAEHGAIVGSQSQWEFHWMCVYLYRHQIYDDI